MFGNEVFTPMIRFGIAITLIQNEQLFSLLLRSYGSNKIFDTLLITAVTDGDWANEFLIGAATIFTRRPIYVYSSTSHHESMNSIYNLDINNENNKPLTIAFHINHFVSLFPVSNCSTPPIPEARYFSQN